MSTRHLARLGMVLLGSLALSALVATAAADVALEWHAVSAGGGRPISLAYRVYGSVGQPVVGAARSTAYQLGSGFWLPVATPMSGTATPTATRTATRTATPTATRTATSTATGRPPFTVNTTDDNDDGTCNAAHCSLREAMAASARSGPDSITFNIPTTATGFNAATGVWTIHVTSPLPTLTNETTIDATTQTAHQGDTNPLGPEVAVDGGTLGEQGFTGFRLGSINVLRGLAIYHFAYAVWVDRLDCLVVDNTIGVDATGQVGQGNAQDGILLINGAQGNTVEGNVISGNSGSGVRISGADTTANTIRRNRIGANADGTSAVPNGWNGVTLEQGAHNNVIDGNLIVANGQSGLQLVGEGTNENSLHNNAIGVNAAQLAVLPNGFYGVALSSGPSGNLIGPHNLIAHHPLHGVLIDGGGSITSTVGNTLTANSITENGGQGIALLRGGNVERAAPTITSVSPTRVEGTACAGCLIEVFSDGGDEGAVYEGIAGVNDAGLWGFTQAAGLRGPFLTATVTDADGNTSAFSAPVPLAATPTATPTSTPTPTPSATMTLSPTPTLDRRLYLPLVQR